MMSLVATQIKETFPAEVSHLDRALQEDVRAAISSEDVARYVAHMTEELSHMARRSGLDLLGYFLEMARIEARAQSGGLGDPN
jgi:glutamate synthase domain-containing protein 2